MMAGSRATRARLTVWTAWLVVMTGANLATPLYAGYAKRFGFSSLLLTIIFAVYAIALVPSLLLFGRLSDRFGRRPVVLGGLVSAGVGLILFAAASSTAWLFAARASQGVAVGMISGPATAALVEFDPLGDARRPALFAGLAQAVGSGLGPLMCGTLAAWAPWPDQLAFFVVLALTVLAGVATLMLPDERDSRREPWRIQLPRVSSEIRAAFFRVGVTAGIVWGALALSLSIVPSYSTKALGIHDLAALGALAAIALAASCTAQITSRRLRLSGPRVQAAGLALLALGLLALAGVAPFSSLPVLIAGAALTGCGHGLTFLSAQLELNTIAPAERRGEVAAAFVCCIYVVVAVTVIAAGLLGVLVSLTVGVATVAVALATAATAAAVWQLRAAAASRISSWS